MNKFRTIDGSGNNQNQGVTDSNLIRLFGNDFNGFEDGISIPRGGEFNLSTLPNPRTISNILIDQVQPVYNFLNASDWLWQWGQLLDHDFALNEASGDNPPKLGDFTPIPIPQDNPKDPFVQNGITTLPFIRVPAAKGTGATTPRQVSNQITAFIDASSVYGSDSERAEFLRDTESGQGLLKTSVGDNGEILLPLNPVKTSEEQPNATGGGALGDFQFVAGDIRANEQIGLTAVHNLLVREHNRVALDLHERLEAGDVELLIKFTEFSNEFLAENPEASPEKIQDEFLYQSARKVIGAKVQVITYQEFLPLLIGEGTIEQYKGFQPDINPQVSIEFANAAFRLGHTLLSDLLYRVDDKGITEIALAEAFFNPENIQQHGVDSVLTGLLFQRAQEIDNMIVDGVRESLFEAGTGGLDLGAVNIARGRETGIPSYTDVYAEIFGTEIKDFDHLRNLGLFSDSVVNLLATAYTDVNQIDLWLGGISELPDDRGGLLGPTLSFFIADQFTRSRDGDEFFYLNDLDRLNILDPDLENTTLASIIRNNVSDPYLIPDNVFVVPFENDIFGDNFRNIINGTALNDLIDGQGDRDYINGGAGDDFLFGGLGHDHIRGNSGDDKLLGGDGNDRLWGNSGNDYINGSAGDDLIYGGAGDDTIQGGTGDDDILAQDGSDIFVFGSELLDGTADIDTIDRFEIIDYLDFDDYLGAGGTISFTRVSQNLLTIDLSGEDIVNVIGNYDALNEVENQLIEQ
ncbi:MAG: peroxidase family protein [Xenococcaceae cyanobacterium MO_188.B29]|nr:peroxidase family protein [Xenococcaceae cyanobacterium MO_188.B29]